MRRLVMAAALAAVGARAPALACDPLCSNRTGGAFVDFRVQTDSVRVWTTNAAFIAEAKRLLATGEHQVPVFGNLHDGRDCDPQWTWHPDAADVVFADAAIGLCDGLPSHIEANEPYWLETVDAWCPWTARVIRVDDRRPPR